MERVAKLLGPHWGESACIDNAVRAIAEAQRWLDDYEKGLCS